MPIILSLLLFFNLPSAAETFVIAADYSRDIPPLYWSDPCTREKNGFGWLLQQRLWRDLNVKTQTYHIDMGHNDSLEKLSSLMKAGKVDAFLTTPAMQTEAFSTTKEPFFWLSDNIYQRKDSKWRYQTWDDLKGHKGLILIPFKNYDRRSKSFKAFSKQHLDLKLAGSFTDSFRQLSEGEVDYVITYRLIGTGFIDLDYRRKLRALPISNTTEPTFLAIANNSALKKRSQEIDQLLYSYNHENIGTLLLNSSLKGWVQLISQPEECQQPTPKQGLPD